MRKPGQPGRVAPQQSATRPDFPSTSTALGEQLYQLLEHQDRILEDVVMGVAPELVGKDRSQAPRLQARRLMTNPIDAPVEAMKGADSKPPAKLVVRDTGSEQLPTRHQAVGPARDPRNPLLDRASRPTATLFRACLAA
jgi:hypothetical protein